jgi:transcription termination/antitermination protein NusG
MMAEEFKWYVVHTYSGFEEKAKQALLERAKSEGLAARVGDVFVPKVAKEQTTKTGKKKTIEKTSYPGYIIVQLSLDDHTRLLVKNTPKITGFVGDSRNPRPLTDQEVLRLRSPEAAKEQAAAVQRQVQFEKGETVKVIDGPFTNFDGVVDEVKPDKSKLRVLVAIFGRETPVELDFTQVKKLS